MKRNILILITIIFLNNIYSQDILFVKDITLRSIKNDIRESLPIINKVRNELTLFLLDEWFINGITLNTDFELIDEYTTSRPDYEYLLGYSIDSNNYYFFFSNDKKNEFYSKTINIINKSSIERPIELDLSEEEFIESFEYNNQFYLLTIKKSSSIIKIYIFKGDEIIDFKQFDFNKYQFSKSQSNTLYNVLNKNTNPLLNPINIYKTDTFNPYSFDKNSKKNKFYFIDGKIYITLDNEINNTKILTINVKNLSSNVKYFEYPNSFCSNALIIKTNSFISNNTIYQVVGCKQGISVYSRNLHTGIENNVFDLQKNQRKIFRHASAIQEGGTTWITQSSNRTLENTKKILKKINTSNISISVNYTKNIQELIIGGYKEIPGGIKGGGMVMTSPGSSFSTPTGTVTVPPTYEYDPDLYGQSKNPRIRKVYFKIINDNLKENHFNIVSSINVFDKVKDYSKKMRDDIAAVSIFKINDFYIYGYYNELEKKYYLRKFK